MNCQSDVVKKFSGATTQLQMTLSEAEELSRALAENIRPLIDLKNNQVVVVGVANGGLMVAKVVSDTLAVPMESMHIRRSGSRYKRAIGSFKPLVRIVHYTLTVPFIRFLVALIIDNMNRLETPIANQIVVQGNRKFTGSHIVLIDDCIDSGQTVILAKKMLADAGAIAVTTGVITLIGQEKNPTTADQFAPIVYLNGRRQHIYPWSQNNVAYKDYLTWLYRNGIEPWK